MALVAGAQSKPVALKVGVVAEARRIRWNAIDWACASALRSGQRSLPVLLHRGLWWPHAELETLASDDAIAAWSALDESIRDAIAERIIGWGLEPAIRPLTPGVPRLSFGDAESRPDLLIASAPGRRSWLGRRLIRRLHRSGWPVTVVG
jgi:hypothetical protein